MGRPEELDDHNNNREENDAVSDVYTSESNTAIYGTPEEDNVTDSVRRTVLRVIMIRMDNRITITVRTQQGPVMAHMEIAGCRTAARIRIVLKAIITALMKTNRDRAPIHMAIVRIVMVFMEISRIKALVRSRRIYTALMQCRPGRIIPG